MVNVSFLRNICAYVKHVRARADNCLGLEFIGARHRKQNGKGIQWLFINFSPRSLVVFPNHNTTGMRAC